MKQIENSVSMSFQQLLVNARLEVIIDLKSVHLQTNYLEEKLKERCHL